MSNIQVTLINNCVGFTIAQFNFARADISRCILIEVKHENGDSEGFSLPFECIKPLIDILATTRKHPAVIHDEGESK